MLNARLLCPSRYCLSYCVWYSSTGGFYLVIRGKMAVAPHCCRCLSLMLFYITLMQSTQSPIESFSKRGEFYYLSTSGVVDDSLDAVVLRPSGQAL